MPRTTIRSVSGFVVLALALAACTTTPSGAPSLAPTGSASAQPSSAASGPSATDPSTTDAEDVGTYKGDFARTGAMPGPGPTGQPEVVWQAQVDGSAAATVTQVGGVVYLVSSTGAVHAFDLGTGVEFWSESVGNPVEAGPFFGGHALLLLIVPDESGALTAVNAWIGETAWNRRVGGGPILGSPVVPEPETIVLATSRGMAYAVDAVNGSMIWDVDLGEGVRRSLALGDGLVYFGLERGEVVALSATDGSERWRTDLATEGSISTPTVANGMVYAAVGLGGAPSDHKLVALDAATGEVAWTYVSPIAEMMYSAAVVDGTAYVVGHDEHVVALDASTGEVQWSTDAGGVLEAVPVVADGVVYAATNDGAAMGLDAATGEILWQVPITGVPWSPAVTGGFVLIGTDAGILYAIGNPE